jgi:hypothetical protein
MWVSGFGLKFRTLIQMFDQSESEGGLFVAGEIFFQISDGPPDFSPAFAVFGEQAPGLIHLVLVKAVDGLSAGKVDRFEAHGDLSCEAGAATTGAAGVGIGKTEAGANEIVAEIDLQPFQKDGAALVGDDAERFILENRHVVGTELGIHSRGVGHTGTATGYDVNAEKTVFSKVKFGQFRLAAFGNINGHRNLLKVLRPT